MDLLSLALNEVESNNDTNKEFFNRLTTYISDKGGSISKNKLEFYKDKKCLQIIKEDTKITFELLDI